MRNSNSNDDGDDDGDNIYSTLVTKNSSMNLHNILHLLLTKTYEANTFIPIFQVRNQRRNEIK